MSCSPPATSVVPNPTGEAALNYLPARGANGTELRLYATHTARVDASIGVALRCTAEHFAGYVRIPVRMVEAPADPAVHRELDALLGTDLPAVFEMAVPDGAAAGTPPAVILPAVKIATYPRADELTRSIVEPLGQHYGRAAMRYLAGSFAALVENGLQHATDSTVGVVAAIAYDRHDDQLRLVVCDSGDRLSSQPDAEGALIDALERSELYDGGLNDLRGRARRDGLEVHATVASGAARARTDSGSSWAVGSGEHVDGLAAIVSIAAH